MHKVPVLLLLGLLALVPSPAGASDRATGEGFGRAVLEGTGEHSNVQGTAILVDFPRRVWIDLRVSGLQRDRNPIYLVWLRQPGGKTFLGGGFVRSRRQSFSGATLVPGSERRSLKHARRANRILVTKLSRPRAFHIAERERDQKWRHPIDPVGTRLAAGRIESLGSLVAVERRPGPISLQRAAQR